MRARLKTFTPAQRTSASEQLSRRLESQPAWRQAAILLCYHALPTEPDISGLMHDALAQGKTVALPQFDAQSNCYRAAQVRDWNADLGTGRFGIPEPAAHCPSVPLNQLDFVLVPGVAFDLRGRRLGRGGGFYDRLLGEVHALKCGVGFDEQLQLEIPVESHDILLDCIVTPSRWLDLRPGRAGHDSVG